jgi:hypothetical protein
MLFDHFNSTSKKLYTSLVFAIAASLFFGLCPNLHAQSSPLTVQPSTGNVGIGTTNPAYKLQVVGNTNLTGNAAHNFLKIDTTASLKSVYMGTDQGGGAPYFAVAQNINDPTRTWQMLISVDNWFQIARPGEAGKLYIGGDGTVWVNGVLSAVVKNFAIDHPMAPKEKQLFHSSLEGPEIAVYYRGEAELVNGAALVVLPDYFESLTRKEERTVQLTAVGGWAPLYVESPIQNGQFTVKAAQGGGTTQRFYWEVKAVRSDVSRLVVEQQKGTPGRPNLAATPFVRP